LAERTDKRQAEGRRSTIMIPCILPEHEPLRSLAIRRGACRISYGPAFRVNPDRRGGEFV
jgi:hypothetical protein